LRKDEIVANIIQKTKAENCILYLVLSIKYENDKWKLEMHPALAGLKLRN